MVAVYACITTSTYLSALRERGLDSRFRGNDGLLIGNEGLMIGNDGLLMGRGDWVPAFAGTTGVPFWLWY